jgi:ribosomal protein S24E
MEIVEKKESKLLGRAELQVLFPDKSGALNRKDAIKEVAQALNVGEGRVSVLRLSPESGTKKLFGTFHVYDSEEGLKRVEHKHYALRLLTKEEKEKLKQEKKKAQQAAAAPAAKKEKKK